MNQSKSILYEDCTADTMKYLSDYDGYTVNQLTDGKS